MFFSSITLFSFFLTSGLGSIFVDNSSEKNLSSEKKRLKRSPHFTKGISHSHELDTALIGIKNNLISTKGSFQFMSHVAKKFDEKVYEGVRNCAWNDESHYEFNEKGRFGEFGKYDRFTNFQWPSNGINPWVPCGYKILPGIKTADWLFRTKAC